MKSLLYLAWRYLAHNRFKSAVLVLSITLIVYVPVGLRVLVGQSAAELTARAEATPLLIGAVTAEANVPHVPVGWNPRL